MSKEKKLTESEGQVPKERAHFRALLLTNPNYFGNLSDSAIPPVTAIKANTRYEEIGCVGFHPQARRLDAVIFVKEPFGYLGGICTSGSHEYVRFYISYTNGTSWDDLGYASVRVYDVPQGTIGPRRLEYAVTVPCSPRPKLCKLPNTILARAILSWNQIPPANQPDWPPVWGEVHDTHIQVDPRWILDWVNVVDDFQVKLPSELAELVDLGEPLKLKEAPALSVAELHAAYKEAKVEPHRYAFPTVEKLLAHPAAADLSPSPAASIFQGLDINLGALVDAFLNPGDGNTTYEEMECVGFNPDTSELVAVLRIKKPAGYAGGPCKAGSLEYVTFWADLNGNGTFETCLGTASVRVHDIDNIPKEGLEYSVSLPVNLSAYRRPCEQGPRLVPIRAILSWASVPPCAFPNKTPVWGNRDETLILLPPGKPPVPGSFMPVLSNVSSVAVCDIDQGSGFAPGDRPFGGAVYIIGDIPGANSIVTPDRFKYRLFYRNLPAGSWQPLANDFGVTVNQQSGPGTFMQVPLLQQVDTSGPYVGYYTYREFGIGTNTWRRIAAPYVGMLGVWHTGQPMANLWEIRVEAVDTLTGITYFADTIHCPDLTTRENVIVTLDEFRPVPSITITHVSTDGGATWQPAVACADFTRNAWIRGNYSVSDSHFSTLTLTVEPASEANGATPSPSSRSYPIVPTGGETGIWTLNTGPMNPCGYVVRLDAWDRTIVSGGGGWHDFATVGFCLKTPTP